MKCLKCGYENERDAVFCEKCGTRLLPETPKVLNEEQWYYAVHGQSTGPCTIDEIIALFKQQSIDVNTYVWKEGMSDWQEFGYSELSTICFGQNWFCRTGDELFGPIAKAVLLDWYSDSRIDGNTYVWCSANNAWHALKEMGILPKGSSAVSEAQWYYRVKDENKGPYTTDEMAALYRNGTLNDHSMVWKSGEEDWEQLSKTELYDRVAHSKRPSFGKKTMWIALAAVFVVVVGVGGYLFVQNQARQQQALKQAQQQAEKAQKDKVAAQEKAEKAQAEKAAAEKARAKAQAAKKKAQQAQAQAQAQAQQAQAEAEKAQQAQEQSTSSSSSSNRAYVVDTNGSSLLVRDEPSTDGSVVGRMNDGDRVQITDTEEVDGQTWGKIGTNKWVFMTDGSKTYVKEGDDD